jgi:hypothetical protein
MKMNETMNAAFNDQITMELQAAHKISGDGSLV